MQHYLAHPTNRLRGVIRVPGDKSISHRSIMMGALAEGTTRVTGFLMGEDNLATLAAFRQMGVKIDLLETANGVSVVIEGVGMNGLQTPDQPLDMGNSGTAMRLLMGLLAGRGVDATLIGDASLSKRPMKRVSLPLNDMGAEVTTQDNGCPPVHLKASDALHGMDYVLPMASAQVKSAVLLAGLTTGEPTSVTEPAPTRDHTERMLNGFGYEVMSETLGEGRTKVTIGGQGQLVATDIDVPADFSSAAFFMVAAAIAKDAQITLTHVGMNPTRTGLFEMLKQLGANIMLTNERMVGGEPVADVIVVSSALTGQVVDPKWVPLAIDELPVFCVAAATARGKTTITGAQELRVKESDRIVATTQLLTKLGIEVEELADGWVIHGNPDGFYPTGEAIETHWDHRIAMSAVIASVASHGEVLVSDCDHVNTSFPGFVALANTLGLSVEVRTDD